MIKKKVTNTPGGTRKTSSAKKAQKKTNHSTEKALIQSSIALQKVVVDVGKKFDKLSSEIEKLLQLFEMSAKTLAEKEVDLTQEKKQYKEIINKLDSLVDQNKVLARGVTMEQERNLPELKIPGVSQRLEAPKGPMHIISHQAQDKTQKENINLRDYQKSILSQEKRFKPLPR